MGNLGNKEIMAKNIRHYMEKYNKTRQEMCDALGVKYTTFTDWVKGNSYPRIDKIELMANYFGISKADLVEDRNDDSSLSARDEKDIAKILEQTKEQLLSQEDHIAETYDIFLKKAVTNSHKSKMFTFILMRGCVLSYL